MKYNDGARLCQLRLQLYLTAQETHGPHSVSIAVKVPSLRVPVALSSVHIERRATEYRAQSTCATLLRVKDCLFTSTPPTSSLAPSPSSS